MMRSQPDLVPGVSVAIPARCVAQDAAALHLGSAPVFAGVVVRDDGSPHAAELEDLAMEFTRALAALEQFATGHVRPVAARTALRVRTLVLVDRLEIERGARRLLDGNFAAARYHLAAARRPSLRVRVAVLALQVAPGLVRQVYRMLRPPARAAMRAMARVR
jgi:hypothetical protein